ncbi:MAG: hypothetical protein IKX62_06395 [Bacteroidales bacterium]|nr:hypothetical protein [Bacteroidales bacterium]
MEELLKTFRKEEIAEPIEAKFEPAINKTRIESFNGEMLFTPTKIYFLPRYEEDQRKFNPVCIEIAEIESYRKTGLFGFEIALKNGYKQRLSNVGKKMREGISAAIEARK